jgi:NOGCT (NUC087) domain
MDGKNVYDFIDPDIEAKLNALEEEEERLEGEGFYDSDDEIVCLLSPYMSFWPSRLPCLIYAYDRWTTKKKKS